MCIHEWIQTALATISVVHVVRIHSDTVPALVTTDGGWVVMFFMPAFAAAGVQSFYAWRIYVLSQRQKIFPIVVLGVGFDYRNLEYLTLIHDQCVVTALCAGVIGAVNLKVRLVTSQCLRRCADSPQAMAPIGLLTSSDKAIMGDVATNVSDTDSLRAQVCDPHPWFRFGYGAVSLPIP